VTARKTAKRSRGAELVAGIVAEMKAAHLVPDSKERVLLEEARRTVDRLDELDAILAKSGPEQVTRAGAKAHWAEVETRLLRAGLPKLLDHIVVADTTAGKNPTKQRAVMVRWNREAARRETSARVFEDGSGAPG
jgi:hypothetical protein